MGVNRSQAGVGTSCRNLFLPMIWRVLQLFLWGDCWQADHVVDLGRLS